MNSLPGILIIASGALLRGEMNRSQALMLGVCLALFMGTIIEFLIFLAELEKTNHYHLWKTVLQHYFVAGYSIPFLRYVQRDKEAITRKIKAYMRRPNFLSVSARYTRLLKYGYIAEPAQWLLLTSELESIGGEIELEKIDSRRRSQTLLRLQDSLRKTEQRSEEQSGAVSLTSKEDDASRRLETVVARLTQGIKGMSADEVRNIETRILHLRTLDPNSRLFRMSVREVEGMINTLRVDITEEVVLPLPMKPRIALVESGVEAPVRPDRFNWTSESGTVTYGHDFLLAFQELPLDAQRHVTKQLGMLASQGRTYPSLRTKNWKDNKAPCSPTPCFVSRASQEIRFSWTKKNGVIEVHFVWAKSFGFRGHHAAK